MLGQRRNQLLHRDVLFQAIPDEAAGAVYRDHTVEVLSARNALVEVLNEVRGYIPNEGQSFADAWEPVIKAKIAALVKDGKINAATGEMVTSVAFLAAKGVDYIFDIRYPAAKQYANLVAAGASGAIDGFLAAFKPADARDGDAAIEPDKDAYEYFKKNK